MYNCFIRDIQGQPGYFQPTDCPGLRELKTSDKDKLSPDQMFARLWKFHNVDFPQACKRQKKEKGQNDNP